VVPRGFRHAVGEIELVPHAGEMRERTQVHEALKEIEHGDGPCGGDLVSCPAARSVAPFPTRETIVVGREKEVGMLPPTMCSDAVEYRIALRRTSPPSTEKT